MSGVAIDADQRDRLRLRPAADVREKLDEIELIEEIVLEPQHDLVVGVFNVNGFAPAFEIGGHFARVLRV